MVGSLFSLEGRLSLSLSLTAGAVGMGKKGRAGCADRTFIPEKKEK